MAMATPDRPRVILSQFSRGMAYGEVYGEGSIHIHEDLATRLRREIERAQSRNLNWAEERLKDLRGERGEPLLDVLVASESGEILNAVSTYRSYANNAHLALTIDDLTRFAKESEMFAYPLTGEEDTTLLWHKSNHLKVWPILAGRYGYLDVEDYTIGGDRSDVSLVRIKGGLMGRARFADANVIYGRLGFWENRHLALGRHGAKAYIERARFEASGLLPCDTYVSPLDRDEVLKRGGIPLDSKHFVVNVVRVNPLTTGGDFIASALQDTLEFPYPVVLGYSPLRPWMGEFPKHG